MSLLCVPLVLAWDFLTCINRNVNTIFGVRDATYTDLSVFIQIFEDEKAYRICVYRIQIFVLWIQNTDFYGNWSATVERIFSMYNANKTKVRNRLTIYMMDAILKSNGYVAAKGGSSKVKITKILKSKFNKDMYHHHQ